MLDLSDNPIWTSQSSTQNLREWRARILDGILRGIFVFWLFGLAGGINNIIKAYPQAKGLYQNSLVLAVSLVVLYLGATLLLAFITFNRKVRYELRAVLLLFILYLIGVVGLSLSSFSGDGRIFLFAFILLAAVLFDFRAGLIALGISMLTLIVIGWLEISHIIVVRAQLQLNADNPNSWLSGSTVFLVLSVAVLISVAHILRILEQLYEQSQTKASEMQRLYAALQDMSSSLKDAPALLHALALHMTEAVKATSSNIVSIDMSKTSLTVLAEYWAESAGTQEHITDMGRAYLMRDFPVIMRAMLSGQVLTLHFDDPNLSDAERRQFADYGIKSMLFVPITAHGKLIGDAEIWESRQHREFTLAEKNLVQAMASHAGGIIENSRLFTETLERESELAALLDVSQAVSSSSELPEVLEKAATSIARILRVDFCSISDYFPDQNCIYTRALYSADGNVSGPGDVGHYFSLDEYPATARVLESGEPLIVRVDDPNADHAEVGQLRHDGMSVSLLLPLRVHGQSLGLAELFSSKAGREFESKEIQLARALADQVAVAIEKARLYETMELREAYFRALIENAADGIAIIDQHEVIQYLSPSSEKILGYKPSDLLSTRIVDLIDPKDLPELTTVYDRDITGAGKVIHLELRFKRPDNSWIWLEATAYNLFRNSAVNGVVFNYRDITERKYAEQALRESQARLEGIIYTVLNAIITMDSEQRIVIFNPSAETMFGYSAKNVIGQHLDILIPERFRHVHSQYVEHFGKTGRTHRATGQLDNLFGLRSSGEEFPMEAFVSQAEIQGEKYFTVMIQDITERKRAGDAVQASEMKFRALAENIPSVVYQCKNDSRYTFIFLNDAIKDLTGYSVQDFLVGNLSFFDLYHPDDAKQIPIPSEDTPNINRNPFHLTYRIRHKSGDWRWVDEWGTGVLNNSGEVQYLEGIMVDTTERRQAEKLQEATYEIARAGLFTQSLDELFTQIHSTLQELLHAEYFYIALYDKEKNLLSFPYFRDVFDVAAPTQKPGHGLTEYVLRTAKPLLATREVMDRLIQDGEVELIGPDSTEWLGVPLITKGEAIGVMAVQSYAENIRFSQRDMDILAYVSIQIAGAIERKQNEINLQNRAAELESFTEVSASLRVAPNVSEMIPILVQYAVNVVNAEYGSIFLLERETGDFVSSGWYAIRNGLDTVMPLTEPDVRHKPGEGVTGHVGQTGEIYVIKDFDHDPFVHMLPGLIERLDGVKSGISFPLRASDQIVGVLNILSQEQRTFTDVEIRLLTAIAEMAGNAIYRAVLYEQTLSHADELALAYDNTLEGWARALELRDELTEGHTRRVTEVTLQLARRMGLSGDELVQIRRGATLHDIGKMAVPDAILHKTGPLNDKEFNTIRLHPQHAYDMLSSISYLRPALDIPYCHHEHWDGSGYPRGLKGEEIPFSARIFAVVDVWDALTSDRPYRKAWSKQKTVEYIIENSGKYFDPRVVDVFLTMFSKL